MNAHSPNTGPNTAPSGDVDDEKPLDPATEKVRKKLVKFSAVFMGLNMVALMAVLGAIVYKIGGYGADAPAAAVGGAPVEPGFERLIDVPGGTKVLGASRNGNEVTLTLQMPDGKTAIWFYDVANAQVTGKLMVE
jgi:hypothetical protein